MTLFTELPEKERLIAEHFDSIIQDIKPLNSKQLAFLPHDIQKLSALLTAERSNLKAGYMNNAVMLSAYTRYFMRWNLFRLTSLFAGLDTKAFDFLKDGDYCLDIGSGPLTLPIALYLARPELREKKLNWYCMDTSQNALALGENFFLSCAARLQTEEGEPAWRIVRVKGEIGTRIKNKVSFVSCANMFNELYWDTHNPLEKEAKKYAALLLSYTVLNKTAPDSAAAAKGTADAAAKNFARIASDAAKTLNKAAYQTPAESPCAVFVVEPGIPRAARFVSLLRSALIRSNMHIHSPCPHEGECPMDGKKGGKWCHFILDTENAPKNLLALSEKAGLPKDRAALSFVFASSSPAHKSLSKSSAEKSAGKSVRSASPQPIRICSDPIILPHSKTGRYACAPWGLTLVTGSGIKNASSGDLIFADLSTRDIHTLPVDRKSGAKIVDAE